MALKIRRRWSWRRPITRRTDIPKDRLATRAFSGTAVDYGHFGQARGIHMRICHRIALKSFNLKISNAQNETAEEERRLTHLGWGKSSLYFYLLLCLSDRCLTVLSALYVLYHFEVYLRVPTAHPLVLSGFPNTNTAVQRYARTSLSWDTAVLIVHLISIF